jgi:hypothetical protein
MNIELIKEGLRMRVTTLMAQEQPAPEVGALSKLTWMKERVENVEDFNKRCTAIINQLLKDQGIVELDEVEKEKLMAEVAPLQIEFIREYIGFGD